MMSKLALRAAVLAPLVLAAASSATAAQTPDSALAVSRSGKGLFRVNIDGGTLWGGTFDGDVSGAGVPTQGAGTRMMWYPRKGAFRAGGIDGTQWDAANTGDYSVAIGLSVRASGNSSVAMGLRATSANTGNIALGEDVTATGVNSVVLGYHAATMSARNGSFIFGDRSTVDTVAAPAHNTATFRTTGGFSIFTGWNTTNNSGTGNPGATSGIFFSSGTGTSRWCGHTGAVISSSTCAYLSTGGTWTNSSDVSRKHLFETVHGEEVLARLRSIPIRSWSYRTESAAVRHLGPTAQDFRAAFGLGQDSVTIATVDADGVALAAAKALEARSTRQAEEIAALRDENARQKAQLAEMQERLARIEALLRAQAEKQ